MRKEVLKELRKRFAAEIRERCNTFVLVAGYRGLQGSDLFVWHFAVDLKFYILLLPNPKSYRDSFMIELTWSEDAEQATIQCCRGWQLSARVASGQALVQ